VPLVVVSVEPVLRLSGHLDGQAQRSGALVQLPYRQLPGHGAELVRGNGCSTARIHPRGVPITHPAQKPQVSLSSFTNGIKNLQYEFD
jgi:hypothetical protein